MGIDDAAWLRAPGISDLFTLYADNFDDVYAQVFPLFERVPQLTALFGARSDEERARAQDLSRQRTQRLADGDWDFYVQELHNQGRYYATLGMEFGAWQEIAVNQLEVLTDLVMHSFADDRPRMTNAIKALHWFSQRSLVEMGKAYMHTSENQLRQWQAVVEHMSYGICLVEPETFRIHAANTAFRHMYGLGEALGTVTFVDLFHPEELAKIRAEHRARAHEQGRVSYETVHVRPDGSEFPVLVDCVRIPAFATGSTCWAISMRDLSERKQMDALLLRSVELEAENRRVIEASRLKSEFLANMSHELRTPLNAILGFSELLAHGEVGPLQEQQRDFIHDIYTSGKHLLRLINDMLDLSKIEAGKMEFRPEDIDMARLVSEVLGVLRPTAQERKLQIKADIASDLGAVHLDPVRLKQVLYNYLSNAIKFSPQGQRIDIRVQPHESASFRLEVEDHGEGIAEAELPRLFLEFEQLDRGRNKTHAGTGLGLALTRRIVEAQGGTVGASSAIGRGSTFYAVLPRTLPAHSVLPSPRCIPAIDADAPRILVVEDNPLDQDCIVRALLKAGFAVDTAATGAQALRAVREQRYVAITLDLLLPDTNGLALLHDLRRAPHVADVPVIVISVVQNQIPAGFVVQGALQKPLQPDDLMAALHSCGVERPTQGPVLIVDDDDASARLMAASLRQLGFSVRLARDGEHAFEVLQAGVPAAVVLDLSMPKLDGFGFLRRFREDERWKSTPVLIWTVKDLSIAEREQLLRSASAVLHKDGAGARALIDSIRVHLTAAGVPLQ